MDVAVGTEEEALDEIFMVMEYCEQVGSFFHCAPYSFFFFSFLLHPLDMDGRRKGGGREGGAKANKGNGEQGRILAG